MKRKTKILVFLCLMSVVLISVLQTSGGTESYQAAINYDDALDFFNSTGQTDGKHIDVHNGTIYFATSAKKASSSSRTTYNTLGYDVTLTAGGKSLCFSVKRGDTLYENEAARRESGGYQYILYSISTDDIIRLAQKADPVAAAVILKQLSIYIELDAIVTVKRSGSQGDITENGSGGLTEIAPVYHLKYDSHLQELRNIFFGHTFKTYIDIPGTLDNYQQTLIYSLGGEDVRIGASGYGMGSTTLGSTTIPNVLYSGSSVYKPSYRTMQNFTLVSPWNEGLNLSRPGYHLVSGSEWAKSDGTTFAASVTYNPKVINASAGTASGTQVLYANWKKNPYHIHYDANGGRGSMADTDTTYATSVNLRKNTYTKTGHVFLGWSTTKVGTLVYKDKAEVKNLTTTYNGTVTLYAVWTPDTYTITLEQENATTEGTRAYYEKYGVGNYKEKVATNAISSVTVPKRTGYTFGGFYTGKNGTGTRYIDAAGKISASSTEFTTDTILYAYWIPNTYTIRYHGCGGSGTMADTDAVYDKMTTLRSCTFERTGYTFKGWALTEQAAVSHADKVSVTNLTAVNGGVVDLYAVWEANIYTITLNDMEADTKGTETFYEKYEYGNFKNKTCSSAEKIEKITIPVKPGYLFSGYFTDRAGSGSAHIDASGRIVSQNTAYLKDTTLFAKWLAKTFTVTFDKQGGKEGSDSVTATYNQLLPAAEAPQKAGYTFGGYYTGKNGTGTQYYDALMNTGLVYQQEKNQTVYAFWTDTFAPDITLNVSSDKWTKDAITLTAYAVDVGSGLKSVQIYRINSDESLSLVANATDLNGAKTKELAFVNTTEGVVRYKAVASDMSGNTAESYNTVYYDTKAPTGEIIKFDVNGTVFDIVVDVTDINAGN